MYKSIIKPIFFLFKPEFIHGVVFSFMKLPGFNFFAKKFCTYENPELEKKVFRLNFKNPVGLAAGLDKDGEVFEQLGALGFAFVEVGTVTPKPQPGNPKPRLFRLKKDKALINRMGFNNKGVEFLTKKLKQRKSNLIIGANIGKNKVTPNEEAYKDYEICFRELFEYVDYFVVNVSSPNTPNLRALQEKEPLKRILNNLMQINKLKEKPKPLLLKIAPDLSNKQLDDIVEIVSETNIDGLIATNTTIARTGLSYEHQEIEKIGAGGLSGKPVKDRSTEVIKYLNKKSEGKIKIIGVGGISNAEDVKEKLDAGACLVQIYTSFIFEGPGVVKKINKDLAKQIKL